jgi:hypothetical protein
MQIFGSLKQVRFGASRAVPAAMAERSLWGSKAVLCCRRLGCANFWSGFESDRRAVDLRAHTRGARNYGRVAGICGHSELIPASGLQQGLRLPPFMPVLDLERRFRCRECDRRGRVVVSIKWAAED